MFPSFHPGICVERKADDLYKDVKTDDFLKMLPPKNTSASSKKEKTKQNKTYVMLVI